MVRKSSSVAATLAIALALGAVSPTAIAVSAVTALEAEKKIALAAKEAAVVEDIVKAACMMHLDIDTDRHGAMIARDTSLFSKILKGLQFGDAEYGFTRENNSKVIDAIRTLQADWLPFSERAEAALASDKPTAELVEWLSTADVTLLKDVDDLVGALQNAYGKNLLPLHLAVATKLAARQATVAQRVAKASCLVTAGIKTEAMRAEVTEMTALFDNTLAALRDGMPMLGIQPPRTDDVRRQWDVVGEKWAVLRASVAPVAAGETLDAAALEAVSQHTSALIEAVDAVVALYELEI